MNAQQVLDFWSKSIERFNTSDRHSQSPSDHLEIERDLGLALWKLADQKIDAYLDCFPEEPPEGADWNSFADLLNESMFFIELRLVNTDHSGLYLIATEGNLISGFRILSAIYDVALYSYCKMNNLQQCTPGTQPGYPAQTLAEIEIQSGQRRVSSENLDPTPREGGSTAYHPGNRQSSEFDVAKITSTLGLSVARQHLLQAAMACSPDRDLRLRLWSQPFSLTVVDGEPLQTTENGWAASVYLLLGLTESVVASREPGNQEVERILDALTLSIRKFIIPTMFHEQYWDDDDAPQHITVMFNIVGMLCRRLLYLYDLSPPESGEKAWLLVEPLLRGYSSVEFGIRVLNLEKMAWKSSESS